MQLHSVSNQMAVVRKAAMLRMQAGSPGLSLTSLRLTSSLRSAPLCLHAGAFCSEDLCRLWISSSAWMLQCLASITPTDTVNMQCQCASWHRRPHVSSCLKLSPKHPVTTFECSRSMICKVKHLQGQTAQHRPRKHGHNLLVCSRGSQPMTCQMYKSLQTRLGVLPWQEPVPHASLSCVKRCSLHFQPHKQPAFWCHGHSPFHTYQLCMIRGINLPPHRAINSSCYDQNPPAALLGARLLAMQPWQPLSR
jgi:hypothetical protein